MHWRWLDNSLKSLVKNPQIYFDFIFFILFFFQLYIVGKSSIFVICKVSKENDQKYIVMSSINNYEIY